MKVCNECKNRRKRITAIRIAGDEPDGMDRVSFCETKRHIYTHRDIYNHMEDIFGNIEPGYPNTWPEAWRKAAEGALENLNKFFEKFSALHKEETE